MNQEIHNEVRIPVNGNWLPGELHLPASARGIVIFSHGSGSSRHSSRNKQVATCLHQHGLGTLLFDLLTEEEDRLYENRFDIDLLTKRLIGATQWLVQQPAAHHQRIGYFGASTGAASALQAAAAMPEIAAVVSRGGRPDLAADHLSRVQAPVLLLAGSNDREVLQLNQEAFLELGGNKKLQIIEGASHLFEEEGALEEVALAACNWFEAYLSSDMQKQKKTIPST